MGIPSKEILRHNIILITLIKAYRYIIFFVSPREASSISLLGIL